MKYSYTPFSHYRLLAILLFLPIACYGQQTNSFIYKLDKNLALHHQLQDAPFKVEEQLKQNVFGLSQENHQQLMHAFRQAFQADTLWANFKEAFEKKDTSGKYQQKMNQWLAQPATKTVNKAQQEFYTLDGKRKRIIAMYELDKNPTPAKRLQLFKKWRDTTSARQAAINNSVAILSAVIKGVDMKSDQYNFTDSQMKVITQNMRTSMFDTASKEYLHNMEVKYHNVTTGNLNTYTGFYETPPGQWLSSAINQSMNEAYKAASRRFLRTLKSQ